MNVKIVQFKGNLAVVEFTDQQSGIQRKYVPRAFLETSSKGPATLSEDIIATGIEYSTVHLVEALGEFVGLTSIATIQNELRQAGLWLRDDYRKKPHVVDLIIKRHRVGTELDTTTVLNAAFQYGG